MTIAWFLGLTGCDYRHGPAREYSTSRCLWPRADIADMHHVPCRQGLEQQFEHEKLNAGEKATRQASKLYIRKVKEVYVMLSS